jgi:hypothetical protein
MLAWQGLTHIYVAACSVIAVISVTAGLTAWTNGHQLWITHAGQREPGPPPTPRPPPPASPPSPALARTDPGSRSSLLRQRQR